MLHDLHEQLDVDRWDTAECMNDIMQWASSLNGQAV